MVERKKHRTVSAGALLIDTVAVSHLGLHGYLYVTFVSLSPLLRNIHLCCQELNSIFEERRAECIGYSLIVYTDRDYYSRT